MLPVRSSMVVATSSKAAWAHPRSTRLLTQLGQALFHNTECAVTRCPHPIRPGVVDYLKEIGRRMKEKKAEQSANTASTNSAPVATPSTLQAANLIGLWDLEEFVALANIVKLNRNKAEPLDLFDLFLLQTDITPEIPTLPPIAISTSTGLETDQWRMAEGDLSTNMQVAMHVGKTGDWLLDSGAFHSHHFQQDKTL
jgi:hypothetical protein